MQTRNTIQRQIVLQAVNQMHNHLIAQAPSLINKDGAFFHGDNLEKALAISRKYGIIIDMI